MRVLLFVNNWVGWQVARWLREQGESIVGLVVHPSESRRFGEELISDLGLDSRHVFLGSDLHVSETLQAISTLEAEIGVSAYFGYILQPELLEMFPRGCINLHPSYLPFNRGAYPNVWSIIERSPSGVTLHYIDRGVDTGDIIAQRVVPVSVTDTGESLYRKLEHACLDLFAQSWPKVCSGEVPRVPQSQDSGCSHRRRDVEAIDEIDLEKAYNAGELINILRARTFDAYPGAYFVHEGRKIYLRLYLEEEVKGKP